MEKTFFIIPVYKVENTLDRCVESVLRQSEGDYEVVLVDDGSPDGAGRRCDEWAVLDPRIHALHRKNGGLGAARNTGIEYVLSRTGTGWLTFLDSDDWIDSLFLKRMYSGIQRTKASIAICRYWRPREFEAHSTEGMGTDSPLAVSAEGFFQWCGKRGTEGLFLGNMACAKLYDIRLWRSIRFPNDGKAHEDMFTTYKILFAAETIAIVDAPLYAYFINPESITGGGYKWSPSRMNAVLAGREQVRFLDDNHFRKALVPCLSWHFGRLLWNLDESEKVSGTEKYRASIIQMLRTDWRRYRRVLEEGNFKIWRDVFRRLHPIIWRVKRLIPFAKHHVHALLFHKT